jgi:hypothetical protein
MSSSASPAGTPVSVRRLRNCRSAATRKVTGSLSSAESSSSASGHEMGAGPVATPAGSSGGACSRRRCPDTSALSQPTSFVERLLDVVTARCAYVSLLTRPRSSPRRTYPSCRFRTPPRLPPGQRLRAHPQPSTTLRTGVQSWSWPATRTLPDGSVRAPFAGCVGAVLVVRSRSERQRSAERDRVHLVQRWLPDRAAAVRVAGEQALGADRAGKGAARVGEQSGAAGDL